MPPESPRGTPTSGPATYRIDYHFADGDAIEAVTLPFAASAPAPFEVARWSVAPGRSSDRDVHRSREIWLIAAGSGELAWADHTTTVAAGDVVAFDSTVPHQVHNPGPELLRVFSVFWAEV